MSKSLCPRCLFTQRQIAAVAGEDITLLTRKLSYVCNSSPQQPPDVCCCGADWIPEEISNLTQQQHHQHLKKLGVICRV